ncbi:hypothetical protein C0991_004754 [Blastosporella zonata]|nr:hypothetical protein C0991_004754 [Blastosporella zonata]
MATLTRPKQLARPATSPLLSSGIPTPFPWEQLVQLQEPEDVVYQEADVRAGPSRVAESEGSRESESQGVLQEPEIMPSIVHVQKSCLITLNNLLSVPNGWHPIVPDRRHSMPSTPQATGTSFEIPESSTSALQTLVTNLRTRDGTDDMIQISSGNADAELLNELHLRTNAIKSTLEPADALLATSIVSLLSHFQRLSTIQSSPTRTLSDTTASSHHDVAGPSDPFSLLRRQLSDLQVERLLSQPDLLPGAPPVLLVEAALLWDKIDEELEAVVVLCKERTEDLSRLQADTISLPPEYDLDDHYEDYQHDALPEYEGQGTRTSIDSKSRHTPHSPTISARQMDEKMRLDLEGVAMAIDRLYLVAPQLHNQRVELKSTKVAQMERARREGSQTPQSRSGKQKEKESEIQELERMWELLGKASQRSLVDQSVVLEGGLPARLEKARQRDLANKHAFVEQLANHSSSGRLHGQDAVLQPRTKDPHALLTLPEFMREAVPASVIRADPQAMLTLPEFVREPPPAPPEERDSEMLDVTSHKYKKSLRHRSLSAPSLAWLRSSSSKTGSSSSSNSTASHTRSKSRGANSNLSTPSPGGMWFPPSYTLLDINKSAVGFEVQYVAENHENLQHVLVFFTVTGALPGVNIEAEVLPPFPENHSEGGDRLIISSGPRNSLPLLLPARILPGKQEVRVQRTHYEIKLTTVAPRPSVDTPFEDPPPLLDAAQLSAAKPSSFICASCSLIIVQATKVGEYRDLPSEHWQELVDAWMCHSDQKLHDQVMRHGKGGFWPEPGQGLVGGSYVLFEESSMAQHNLHLADEVKPGEDWRLARCLCGAVLGRSQNHSMEKGTRNVFRLLKFAIRPVSLNIEPFNIPLSAFLVEDMTEFIRAHATYRFVILDEEDELPRILIWLFKPSIRLSYTTPTPYAIPKSASIHAAKVLFKILTPSERTSDLKSILGKYPGFPQAEYLSYPMPICRRLAGLLKESNSAYPETMRFMTGLEVGWLHRA